MTTTTQPSPVSTQAAAATTTSSDPHDDEVWPTTNDDDNNDGDGDGDLSGAAQDFVAASTGSQVLSTGQIVGVVVGVLGLLVVVILAILNWQGISDMIRGNGGQGLRRTRLYSV